MASKSLFFQRILILKPVLSELRAAEVTNLHSLMTFKKTILNQLIIFLHRY